MEKESSTNRPTLVTVICIIAFIFIIIGLIGTIFFYFISPIGQIASGGVFPVWYLWFSIVVGILFLVGFFFIWKMKRWGLIFYTILIFINFGVPLAFGFLNFPSLLPSLILQLITVGLLWTQFNKMV